MNQLIRRAPHCVTARVATALLLGAAMTLPASPVLAGGPAVHALTGARIVVGPGQEIASGTLVLRDGVIEAVGADVEPPADARIWELEDLTVYPALVEPYSTAKWPEVEEDARPAGGHANALVTPERDVTPYAHQDGAAKKLREAGYAVALVAPEQGMFRGSDAVVSLRSFGDDSKEDPLSANLLRRGVAQHVTMSATSTSGGYPNSMMGSVALFRQTLYDARWYAAAQEAYGKNGAQGRPGYNAALDALAEVAQGDGTVILQAQDLLEVLRIARMVDEFGLEAHVVATGSEYQRLDSVVATGLPLIVPVGFPDAPTVGEEDDLSVTLETLRHWDQAPDNPRRLIEAGASVVFTTHGLGEPKEIHGKLAAAIERGLSRDQALAAVTTGPAEMLGLGDLLGTIEVGKIANLVVVEGDLLVDKPKIRSVWIDGHRSEIKESKPPEIDPLGTWELTLETGGGQMSVTVIISGTIDDLSGTIASQMGELPLTSVDVSGKNIDFAMDSTPLGMPGSITFSMAVSGETSSGTGDSPQGSFTFKGKRTSKPEASPEDLSTEEDRRHDAHHHHGPHGSASSKGVSR